MKDIQTTLSLALKLDDSGQTSSAFYKYLESINLIASELYQHATYDIQRKSFFNLKRLLYRFSRVTLSSQTRNTSTSIESAIARARRTTFGNYS
jgi:hypothetical protein